MDLKEYFCQTETPRKYFKAEELTQAISVIIATCRMEEIGQQKQPKPVLYFRNVQEGLILNRPNFDTLVKILGSSETDTWANKKIILFCDPTVMFGDRAVGGIRVRAPEPSPQQPPRAQSFRTDDF